MLNGIDPIIIIQLSKSLPRVSEALAKIPLLADNPVLIDAPPIPIYLSEQLTGLFIDSESKNVDAETSTETKTDGTEPDINQKGLNNSVSINLKASLDSTGVTLLTALMDVIYGKLTAKEYSITYLNGPITVFRGLLNGFSVDRNPDEDVYRITVLLSKGAKNTPKKNDKIAEVQKSTGSVPLQTGG